MKIGEDLMRQISFEMIDKKLAKKNAELQEVRETRQKLLDKEKEIKIENLNVSSASILPLLEVLRNNRQIEIETSENKTAEIISKENPKIENVASRLDSISEIVKA